MKKITFLLAFLVTTMLSYSADMSGTYTIGTGGTYATLGAAVTDLNAASITGNVTLEVTSDITETGGVKLLVSSIGTNTITIKPAATVTPTITFTNCVTTTGAISYTGFGVDNTNNILFDGSNTVGGTTKDMTFKMNDATNGRNIIQLFGNCDNISIKNLNVVYQAPMSTANSTRAIYLNGQSTGAADNFIVENCTMGDATLTPYYAVSITGYGTAPAIYSTNNKIKNNILYGRIRPVYLYVVGTAETSNEVSGNTIYTLGGANGTTTYSIMWNNWAGTFNIKNNKIPKLSVANSSGTSGVYGISGLSSAAGSVVNMENNFIGGIAESSGLAIPSVFSLMYLQDNATYNISNNTFYYSSLTNATEKSNIHISGSTCIVNLQNNIICNKNDNSTAYCIWKSNGTLISDNNILTSTGAGNIGLFSATAKKSLADWQTFPNDINSKSFDVNFMDAAAGDLRITGASIGDQNLGVTRLAEVLKDMFGTDRATKTYAGAHEASNLLIADKVFTVTVPNGTEKVYLVGSFPGKDWDIANPHELTATANPNEFSGTFACEDGLEYKYFCEKDWDYSEAVYGEGSNPPAPRANRSYNATDNVPIWINVNKITLNVSFATTAVPLELYVKGGFNSWATPLAMNKSGNTYSLVLGGNPGDKYAPNMEYKYYTNDGALENWEADSDGNAKSNRWSIAPLMNDEIARFTTLFFTNDKNVTTEARIMRNSSGIEVSLSGEAKIELYNIKGMLIDSKTVTGSYSRSLDNGIYIIRINGKATKFIK